MESKVPGMRKYKSMMFVRSLCKCSLLIFIVYFKMRLIIKWEGDLQDIPFGTGDMFKTLNRCGYPQGICRLVWSL